MRPGDSSPVVEVTRCVSHSRASLAPCNVIFMQCTMCLVSEGELGVQSSAVLECNRTGLARPQQVLVLNVCLLHSEFRIGCICIYRRLTDPS